MVIDCLDYQGFLDLSISRSEASRPIMAGYSYTSHQFNHNEPKVQFANTLPMSNVNNYFVSTMNTHVDVARYDTSKHIASASNYSDGFTYANYNSEFYMQKPLSNDMHALNFNDTSNIQHYPLRTQSIRRPMDGRSLVMSD